MNKTWVVQCPEKHGWSLSTEELERVKNDYFGSNLKCVPCDSSFSLWQGVKEAYLGYLLSDFFVDNSRETGTIDVEVGKALWVTFAMPFEDNPKVSLTPQFNVHAAPTHIGKRGFTALSCFSDSGISRGKINWYASGKRGRDAIPLWRELLSNAKRHQIAKNHRAEIVELESAVEVFIGEYLGKNLKTKLRQKTIDWILKRGIEDQMEIGFIELTGQPVAKMHPVEYRKWQKLVKATRNNIVHRGSQVTPEQAINAQKATFDILTKIDNTALIQFQISVL